MNDTLKWVLIGVGAYLLYEQYSATPAAIAATPVTPSTPATPAVPTAPATTTAQTQAQQNLATLTAAGPNAILAAAKVPATQLYNASQWNYYLPAIGVTYQPDLSNYGMDLTTAVPVTTWWNSVTRYFQAAASSPSGLGRLGKTKKATPLIPVTFDMNATGW